MTTKEEEDEPALMMSPSSSSSSLSSMMSIVEDKSCFDPIASVVAVSSCSSMTNPMLKAKNETKQNHDYAPSAPTVFSCKSCLQDMIQMKQDNKLVLLNLAHYDFTSGDDGMFSTLLEILRHNEAAHHQCPSSLDLSGAKFTSKTDLAKVFQALRDNTRVVELNVSNCLSSDYMSLPETFQALEQLLKHNAALQTLNLSGHYLAHSTQSEFVVQHLCRGLECNQTLTSLDLGSCSMNEASARRVLASALVQDTLRALDLSANGPFSVDFLNTSITSYLDQSSSIRSLKFGHSSSMFAVPCLDQGQAGLPAKTVVRPFLQALQNNTTLAKLSLHYCRLTQDVGQAILETLTRNTTLVELDLQFTSFGLRDQGNEIWIRLLPHIQALQRLKWIVRYPPHLVPGLLQALQRNMSLQSWAGIRIDAAGPEGYVLAATNAQPQKRVQNLFRRNQCLTDAILYCRTRGEHHAALPVPTLLPLALFRLSQTPQGTAAAYQVLRHCLEQCVFS